MYLKFTCLKCSKPTLRGTGTDSGLTGVMHDHIARCWSEDLWNETKNLELEPAKEVIKNCKILKNVKLTEIFVRIPGSKEIFSLKPSSQEEIRFDNFNLPARLVG